MSYQAFARDDLGFTTRQLHAGYDPGEHYRSKAVPIYQTAAFELGDYDRCLQLFEYAEEGHSYVRFSNPTNEVLEKRMASLENGAAAVRNYLKIPFRLMALRRNLLRMRRTLRITKS